MPSLTRRRFLGTVGCAAAATVLLPAWAHAAPKPVKKPNIIFILSDDVGLDDIGCYGGRFKTPNIDALAAGGTRFEYCYASPLCGPSRAELLTGRYAFRTGMTANNTGNVMDPAKEIMLPQVMKPAGYVTASVGKWSQMPLEPGDWGFDEYFRFQGSGVYWAGKGKSTYTVNGVTKPIPDDKYMPDMMYDWLADFITRHKDEPFCAYYPMSLVHGKIVRTPDSPPGSRDLYADNIAYMDKLVGKVVAELDHLNIRDNTIIVFSGDNGTAQAPSKKGTLNGEPISGAKHSMKEGGSRVPLIVNWKGHTPAGKICHDLTDFSDFLPTFAEIGGAKLPDGVTIDGHSFAPQIKGLHGTPRDWVYVELMGFRYVATKKWKLNNSGELFDMSQAPYKENLIPATTTDAAAIVARQNLQAVMDGLVGKNRPAPTEPMPTHGNGVKKKGGKKAGKGAGKRRKKALAAQ